MKKIKASNSPLGFSIKSVFPWRGAGPSQLYEATIKYNGKTRAALSPSLIEISVWAERRLRVLRKADET
jgi:hypothetical protein